MSPADRYALLESLMLRAHALGSATEVQIDALLDEMDGVWDAMSDEDRRVANARAAALARIPAPEDLSLIDVARSAGDHDLPRRAA